MNYGKILRVVVGLFVFGLTISVFAKGVETKIVNKQEFKRKLKTPYGFFLNKDYTNQMGVSTEYYDINFLFGEISRSNKFREYLKSNGIYTCEKITQNFENIMKKLMEIEVEKLSEQKAILANWDLFVSTDKFREDYKNWEIREANFLKQVGGSFKSLKYIQDELAKKYGKKREEMVEEEMKEFDKETKEKFDSLPKEIKDKFNQEAMREAIDRENKASFCSGKYFDEYKDQIKKEKEYDVEFCEGCIEDLKNITKSEETINISKGIWQKIVKYVREKQKENFNFEGELKERIDNFGDMNVCK